MLAMSTISQSARLDPRSSYTDNKIVTPVPAGHVEDRMQVLSKAIASLGDGIGLLGERMVSVTIGDARIEQRKEPTPTPKPMMCTLAERIDHAIESVQVEKLRLRSLISRLDI